MVMNGESLTPPDFAQWQEILQECPKLFENPYIGDGRVQLVAALTRRNFHYEARTLSSGKIVPILGREYFPSRLPSISVLSPEAAAHGITVMPVSPSPPTEGWMPASVGLDPLTPVLMAKKRWKRDHYVAVLEQGRCVVNPWGYAIFSPAGHYVQDFCCNDGPIIPFTGIVPQIEKVEGTVAVLAHSWSNGVFHWNMETFPRFELLRLAGLMSEVDYFLVRDMEPWHFEYTDLLGIPREKFLIRGGVAHIQADRLLVCSNVEEADWKIYPPTLEPEPWICAALRDLVPDPDPDAEPTEKIYISRANARSRRMLNESELRSFLEANGFKTVVFEDMSLQDKAKVLRSAAVLVTPNGAALSHVSFMRPGSKCVVLYAEDVTGSTYRDICSHLGINHYHVIYPSLARYYPSQLMPVTEPHREHLVDIRRVAELLDHIGVDVPKVPQFDPERL